MTNDQFLTFLNGLPDSIIEDVEKELYDKLGSAIDAAWLLTVAARIKNFALTGMAIMEVCERTELSQKRAVILQAIRGFIKPAIGVLESIQMYYLLLHQMAQFWDSVPDWEEFSEYVQGILETKLSQAMEAAIPMLIEKAVCGTKFQLKSLYGFQSILNKQLLFTLIMVSLKTQWDLMDQES